MLDWQHFSQAAPAIAAAGARLLEGNEVAFLATVAAAGRPRLHPFVPKIVNGRLVAFIMDTSPKIADLRVGGQYAMHTLPGAEDEEFFIGGRAMECNGDPDSREAAALAMGFVTGIDDHHILFELRIERALWTRWLDFGTAQHRPQYLRWHSEK